MTTSFTSQEIQRLSALLWRLYRRNAHNKITVEVGDSAGTRIEISYKLNGKYARGRIQSTRGSANFELWTEGDALRFRHPMAGRHGELTARRLATTSLEALGRDANDVAVAARIATTARRLEHLSVLLRVEVGIRERRDTLPMLPLAS